MSGRALLLSIALASGVACDRQPSPPIVRLATTTSVGNSGLLDVLADRYRATTRAEVRTQLVGSGIALRMLASGTVDLVISHAPAAEEAALREHPSWRHRTLMVNDFVLVGPPDDPARVRGVASVEEAMRRIAESSTRFLSRGDRSGTHEREDQLWEMAGTRPPASRLIVAGAGMGSTLRAASGSAAYTLTDRATFAQLSTSLQLQIVFEGGDALLNTYGVIVDPAAEHAADAMAFAEWLTAGAGRDAIAAYRVGNGVVAFSPAAAPPAPWRGSRSQ